MRTIDGAEVGEFALGDGNSLLVAMLAEESCRRLLTVRGMQEHCLRPFAGKPN